MQLNPFTPLQTTRLLLRRIKPGDWERILFLRSDEVVNQFILRPESEKTKTKADALQFIQRIDAGIENNNFISWGITLGNDPEIIGTICLWNFSEDRKTTELGYDLDSAFHRKGIMSEALEAVMAYGFHDLDLDKVEAFTHFQNVGSRKLLEKNGFSWIQEKVDERMKTNVIYERLQGKK